MSGYLQRLALGVTRPTRSVHPLVGGLFAKDVRSELRPEPEVETLIDPPAHPLASPSATPGVQQSDAPSRAVGAHERPSPPRIEKETARSQTPPAPVSLDAPDEPVPMPAVGEPLVPRWRETATPERHNTETGRPYEQRDPISAAEPQSGKYDAGVRTVPLAPESRPAASGPREEVSPARTDPAVFRDAGNQPPAAVMTSAGARLAAAQNTQKAEPKGGGEEIRIHIGRIDVIAVPQQPPRAQVKVQRGETLEAYLKRHDRRSR